MRAVSVRAARCALVACLLAVGLAGGARAQRTVPDTPGLLVTSVRVTGDLGPLDREAVEEGLRTQRNRRFLGLPGVTPGLWLYRLGRSGGLGRPVSRALERAGAPPATLLADDLAADRTRLEEALRQEGYRQAEVAVRVDTLGHRARVTFHLAPGPPTTVTAVRYEGLEALPAEERARLVRGSLLRLRPSPDADTAAVPVREAAGQRLSVPRLVEERARVIAFLRDAGYARVGRDSVTAAAFPTEDPLRFSVALRVRPGARYRFGDVGFTAQGPERAPARRDTLRRGDGLLTTHIEDERVLEPRLVRRALRFRPGEWYSRSQVLATKRRLERTGVFAFTEIAMGVPDTTAGGLRLPHRITARTRPRHSIQLEGFVLQRTGALAGAEGAGTDLGLGAGVAYANANVFGGGEAFQARLGGSVAGDFADVPTRQAEATVGLTVPYLVPPFGGLDRGLFDARTRLQLGALTARRDELRLLVRGRLSAGLRLELQHTAALTSLVDVVDFRLSDPDTLAGFEDRFLGLIEDPVVRQAVLEDYARPQVANALRYTLRSTTADVLRRDRGHAREAQLELGGNVPWLLDRYVYTPDTLEGSLPGLPVFGGRSRLTYRQYVRGLVDVRQYTPLSRRSRLALKGVAGAALPYGQARTVPFDRRFYVGGATSVRGFRLRSLGPGRADPAAGTFVPGGEVKLEVSAELRQTVVRRFLQADWELAAFLDAGNVWLGPQNPGPSAGRFRAGAFWRELGVGGGAGLRIGWDFLIVRLDLAWPVRSPVPGEGFFPERRPLLHFGLGQAL